MENGIDISKEYIPVVPVQHYMMGGIATDLNGMTSVEGLYACGEVSCTGVHGANRLASNSLLECLVFGNRSAQHINKAYRVQKPFVFKQNRTYAPQYEIRDYDIMKSHIKEIMMEYCGIMRNEKDLERGYHRMRSMRVMLENSALDDIKIIEVLNMADIAERILKSAIQRRESVGAHYRED
jgi:L-aspartate oxidase